MGDIGVEVRIHFLKFEPCYQDISWIDELPIKGKDVKLSTSAASSDITNQLYSLSTTELDSNNVIVFNLNDKTLDNCAATLKKIPQTIKSNLPIIAMIKGCNHTVTDRLSELGVDDFVRYPYSKQELSARISKYISNTKLGIDKVSQHLKEKIGLRNIIGKSPGFISEINKISQIAKYDATVMITGETGTGKEIVARAIHYLSPRSGKPMITFDCGAVPPELIENELFGHEKGAYTSASSSEKGLIQAAESGTLFLDEIDSLSAASQVKLLRLLQEKEYKPLGSNKLLKADIRFIAASNKNIKKAVKEGRFRSDLYYRLNIIPIHLPPLNKRKDDIGLLSDHFLIKYSKKFNKYLEGFSDGAIQKLKLYDWPGNVRELENTIERAVVLSTRNIIEPQDITIEYLDTVDIIKPFKELKSDVIQNFEINYLKSLLITHNGNITHAANAAKKNRRAFWQLMKKYNIDLSSH